MWSDLAQWFASPAGQRALTDAVVPVVAILVAALIAALIARAAIGRLERRIARESLAAAVAGFVEAARRTATGDPDPGSAARLATESDVRLRLSGRAGADVAAEWALLVALAARGDDPAVVRDRLLEWTRKPNRAKRLFGTDLEALRLSGPQEAPADAAAPAPRTPEPSPVAPAAVAPAAVASPSPSAAVASPSAAVASPFAAVASPSTSAEEAIVERPAAVAASDHTNQARPAPPEVPAAQPAAAGRSGSAQPAWLDDYDDDAHVTRNIPLSTPAPVAASAIRDRGRPGDDIVPT
jgi:hypothetical protein